jgi:hypothetical protein
MELISGCAPRGPRYYLGGLGNHQEITVNHLLELALRTANKSGDWDGVWFIVPASRAAERFGLKHGRYYVSVVSQVFPVRSVIQSERRGDLRLH